MRCGPPSQAARLQFLLTLLALVGCLLGVACRGTETTRRGAKALGNPVVELGRIEALLDRFQAADRSAALSELLGCFTEDAQLIGMEGQTVRGVIAIGSHYEELHADGRREATLLVEDLRQLPASAVVVGRLRGRYRSPGASSTSDFDHACLLVLSRRSVGWRITHMMWARS